MLDAKLVKQGGNSIGNINETYQTNGTNFNR